MQPTPEAIRALYEFTRQPRWKDIDDMLTAEIKVWNDRLLGAPELRQIGECQGRVKALRDLQDLARDAVGQMEKLGLRPSL